MRAQVEDNVPEKRCVIAAMADREDRLREEATLGRRRGEGEGSAEESSGQAARGLVVHSQGPSQNERGSLGPKGTRGAIYGEPVRAGKGRKSWLCLGVSRNTTRGAGSAHKAIPYCLRPPHPKAASQVSLRPRTNLHDVQFSFSLRPTVLSSFPASSVLRASHSTPAALSFSR